MVNFVYDFTITFLVFTEKLVKNNFTNYICCHVNDYFVCDSNLCSLHIGRSSKTSQTLGHFSGFIMLIGFILIFFICFLFIH